MYQTYRLDTRSWHNVVSQLHGNKKIIAITKGEVPGIEDVWVVNAANMNGRHFQARAESLEGCTKVIIWWSNGAHSRILSQWVTSLENRWEKGGSCNRYHCFRGFGRRGSFSCTCSEQREQMEGPMGKREVRNDTGGKEMRSSSFPSSGKEEAV